MQEYPWDSTDVLGELKTAIVVSNDADASLVMKCLGKIIADSKQRAYESARTIRHVNSFVLLISSVTLYASSSALGDDWDGFVIALAMFTFVFALITFIDPLFERGPRVAAHNVKK